MKLPRYWQPSRVFEIAQIKEAPSLVAYFERKADFYHAEKKAGRMFLFALPFLVSAGIFLFAIYPIVIIKRLFYQKKTKSFFMACYSARNAMVNPNEAQEYAVLADLAEELNHDFQAKERTTQT